MTNIATFARTAPFFPSSQLETADIIHSFNWVSGACGYESSKKYQVRYLHGFDSLGRMNIEDNTNLTEQQRLLDTWELKIFENAESLIAQSAYLAENFAKLYPVKFRDKLIIIPPGIDHELFSPMV
jgi:glycosyltransferase involved in cell wall biosynthesis